MRQRAMYRISCISITLECERIYIYPKHTVKVSRVGHEMLFIARELYQKCLRIEVVQSINFKAQQFKAQWRFWLLSSSGVNGTKVYSRFYMYVCRAFQVYEIFRNNIICVGVRLIFFRKYAPAFSAFLDQNY